MLTLFHGSQEIVTMPMIRIGGRAKDFGTGFYCTVLFAQAKKWALRKGNGIVNEYSSCLDEDSGELDILEFKSMTEEWLDFVHLCRTGGTHSHDVVIGPMADDQIFDAIDEYDNGRITRKRFWELTRFKYPTHQMAFCTEASLKYINFVRSQQVTP